MPRRKVSAASRTKASRGPPFAVVPLHRPVEGPEEKHPGESEVPVVLYLSGRAGGLQESSPIVRIVLAPCENPFPCVRRGLPEDSKRRGGVLCLVKHAAQVGFDSVADPFRRRSLRRQPIHHLLHGRRDAGDADVQDLFEQPLLRVEVVVDAAGPELGGIRDVVEGGSREPLVAEGSCRRVQNALPGALGLQPAVGPVFPFRVGWNRLRDTGTGVGGCIRGRRRRL